MEDLRTHNELQALMWVESTMEISGDLMAAQSFAAEQYALHVARQGVQQGMATGAFPDSLREAVLQLRIGRRCMDVEQMADLGLSHEARQSGPERTLRPRELVAFTLVNT